MTDKTVEPSIDIPPLLFSTSIVCGRSLGAVR